MEEQKTYLCKACGAKFHTVEEIKDHAKKDHGMDLSDDQAKMTEEHEHEGHSE